MDASKEPRSFRTEDGPQVRAHILIGLAHKVSS
jgi:hypothetical protein